MRGGQFYKIIIAVLLAVLCVTAGCRWKGGAKGGAEVVSAAVVERGVIEKTVLFTGNIEAQDAVEVFARAPGKVTQKLLKEGDVVKKGQAIIMVDRDEIGYRFKPMAVDSPIDGYVGSIMVDVGSWVYDRNTFNSRPAAVVVRPGGIRVKLDIPERYLQDIRPDTKVLMLVDSLNNAAYEGLIITSSPVIDEKTRTARVEVSVTNTDGRLRHGMFGRINLAVERKENTLIVPYDAISWEGEKQFVYKIEDNKAVRTEVIPGLRNDSHVEMLGGVSENEKVIVGNLLNLKDGKLVTVGETAADR